MKDQILKIAGVKSEKEFYSKYPSEEAFMKAHGKEFKKAKLGAAMTPKAQDGSSESISNFMNSVGNKNCVGSTWHAILGDGDGGGSGGAAAKVIPEWKEISNIENLGLDKSGRKALKAEYEAIKDKYKGLDLNTYVAAKRDAERTSRQFANPERAKYFDPSGKLLPNVDPRNIDPYLRFYREKFPTQSKLSAEDILGVYGGMEGGLSNYEKYANVGYQKPMKEGGQLHKLQQLTDFGNPPIAAEGFNYPSENSQFLTGAPIGSSIMGSDQPKPQFIDYDAIHNAYQKRFTGKTDDEILAEKLKTPKQKATAASSTSGSGVDLNNIMNMFGSKKSGSANTSGLFSGGGNESGLLKSGGISMMAKKGKKLKAQTGLGLNSPAGGTMTGVNPDPYNIYGSIPYDYKQGQFSQQTIQQTIQQPPVQQPPVNPYTPPPVMNTQQTGTLSQQIDASSNALPPPQMPSAFSNITSKIPVVGQAIGLIQDLKNEEEMKNRAKQMSLTTGLQAQAAGSKERRQENKYVRPEDRQVQPGQLFPVQGVGTNVLARDGMSIGGNPTEIQNMYNPGTLYSDLGYEPLVNPNVVKQYAMGGAVPQAQSGFMGGMGSMMGSMGNMGGSNFMKAGFQKNGLFQNLGSRIGSGGTPNAGSKLGQGIGNAIDPSGVLGTVGGLVGGYLDPNVRQTEGYKKDTKRNIDSIAGTNTGQAILAEHSTFVRDGGDVPSDHAGWMSHNWNPQVITKFGDVDVSQMHNIATQGMNTLRTGGHITQNNMYPQDKYALGGDMKVTWGGQAKPLTYNPFLEGGEAGVLQGNSHETRGSNGETGIGIVYGKDNPDSYTDYAAQGTSADADVEAEGGETYLQGKDSETGEPVLHILGEHNINNVAANFVGRNDLKGKTYKSAGNMVAASDGKLDGKIENVTDQINKLKVIDSHDKLKLTSLERMLDGYVGQKKNNAKVLQDLATIQGIYNDTAKAHGLDAKSLMKGKGVIDKEALAEMNTGKKGKTIKAQGGYKTSYGLPSISPDVLARGMESAQQWLGGIGENIKQGVGSAYDWTKDKISHIDPTSVISPTVAMAHAFSQKAAATKPIVKATPSSNGMVADVNVTIPTVNLSAPTTAPVTAYASNNTSGPAPKKGGPKPRVGSDEWYQKVRHSDAPEPTVLADGSKKFVNPDGSYYIIKDKIRTQYDKSGKPGRVDKLGTSINDAAKTQSEVIPSIPYGDDGTTDNSTIDTVAPNKRNPWIDAFNQVLPYLRETDQEDLDPNQLMGEMYALSNNQLEPVQAQLYHPELDTPYDISLQDQLNANQADFNATQRAAGYNPAAKAALDAIKYAANSKVLGEQFRLNQAEKAGVYAKNRDLLNDAQLKNLQVLDQQYARQAQAKSRTKEVTQAALNSISDKIAKHQLENRELAVYENLYNYRYNNKFKAINENPLFQANIPNVSGSVPIYDNNNNIVGYQKMGNVASTNPPIPSTATPPFVAPGKKTGKKGADIKKTAQSSIARSIKNL